MVDLFIKHVLGVGKNESGIYGKTSGYYGTVEQQGRLTLCLHMLLGTQNSMTPQEIRDRIMDPHSDFQKAMVEYLESVHMGEFINGNMEDVASRLDEQKVKNPLHVPPTETLPQIPPPKCDHDELPQCDACEKYKAWWQNYTHEVDEILYLSKFTIVPLEVKALLYPKESKIVACKRLITGDAQIQ